MLCKAQLRETRFYDLQEGFPDAKKHTGQEVPPSPCPLAHSPAALLAPLLLPEHAKHAVTSVLVLAVPSACNALFLGVLMACALISFRSLLTRHLINERSSMTILLQLQIEPEHCPPFLAVFLSFALSSCNILYVLHVCLFIVLSPLLTCKLH